MRTLRGSQRPPAVAANSSRVTYDHIIMQTRSLDHRLPSCILRLASIPDYLLSIRVSGLEDAGSYELAEDDLRTFCLRFGERSQVLLADCFAVRV